MTNQPPTSDPGATSMVPRRRAWIVIAAILACVAIVISAVAIVVSLSNVNSDQAFLIALRADPDSRVDGLSDEQLLVSLRGVCARIEDGQTLGDATAAAENNWSTVSSLSKLTEAEYLGNVGAIYRAAAGTCEA